MNKTSSFWTKNKKDITSLISHQEDKKAKNKPKHIDLKDIDMKDILRLVSTQDYLYNKGIINYFLRSLNTYMESIQNIIFPEGIPAVSEEKSNTKNMFDDIEEIRTNENYFAKEKELNNLDKLIEQLRVYKDEIRKDFNSLKHSEPAPIKNIKLTRKQINFALSYNLSLFNRENKFTKNFLKYFFKSFEDLTHFIEEFIESMDIYITNLYEHNETKKPIDKFPEKVSKYFTNCWANLYGDFYNALISHLALNSLKDKDKLIINK